MNYQLIKEYIDKQPIKVASINWSEKKIEYTDIKQCQKRTVAYPEELVRAYLITKLVNELGYNSDRIEIERVYTAGRPHTNTSRIDVIVREDRKSVV